MDDKLKKLYDLYKNSGLIKNSDYNTFAAASEDQRKKLYDLGKQSGLFKTTDYNTFNSAFKPIKKKEPTVLPSEQPKAKSSSATSVKKTGKPSVGSGKEPNSYQYKDLKVYDIDGVWHTKGKNNAYTPIPEQSQKAVTQVVKRIKDYETKKSIKESEKTLDIVNKALGQNGKQSNAPGVRKDQPSGTTSGVLDPMSEMSTKVSSKVKAITEVGLDANESQLKKVEDKYNAIAVQSKLKEKGYDVDVDGDLNSEKTIKAISKERLKDNIYARRDWLTEAHASDVDRVMNQEVNQNNIDDVVDYYNSKFNSQGYIFSSIGTLSGRGRRTLSVKYEPSPGIVLSEKDFDVLEFSNEDLKLYMKESMLTNKQRQFLLGTENEYYSDVDRIKYNMDLLKIVSDSPNKFSKDFKEDVITMVDSSKALVKMYEDISLYQESLNSKASKLDNLQKEYERTKSEVVRENILKLTQEILIQDIEKNKMVQSLKKAEGAITKISGKALEESIKDGNVLGYLSGKFALGLTSVPKMATSLAMEIMPGVLGPEYMMPTNQYNELKAKGLSDYEITDLASKELKRNILSDVEKGIVNVASLGTTTKEHLDYYDYNDITKAAGFLAESIGTSFSAGGNSTLQKIAFFAMSYNAMEEQMRGEEFDRLTEIEKKAISVPYGIAIGALEKFGFDIMKSGGKAGPLSKIVNNVIARSLTNLPKNATVEAIEMEINKEVSKMIAVGTLRIVNGALSEGFVEGTQQMAEISEKYIVNKVLGKDKETGFDYFKDVPDIYGSWDGFFQALDIAKEDAYYGALGGLLFSGAQVSRKTLSDAIYEPKRDEDFSVYSKSILDDNLRELIKNNVITKLSNGEISKDDAAAELKSIDEVHAVLSKIDNNLSIRDQRNSFNLLLERGKLEAEIKGKDENLVARQKERISEINNTLQNISKNAVQEQATSEVPVQPEASVGEEVEGGKPEAKTEVVTEEGKQEVGAERTSIEVGDKFNYSFGLARDGVVEVIEDLGNDVVRTRYSDGTIKEESKTNLISYLNDKNYDVYTEITQNAQEENKISPEEGSKQVENPSAINKSDIIRMNEDAQSKLREEGVYDLFIGATLPTGSIENAIPINVDVVNGITVATYANEKTGLIDTIISGFSENNFVGYYRIYENGKPTNRWSSKFENQETGDADIDGKKKDNFKTMISSVQERLPSDHRYTEKTSISTDGLRVWGNQIDRGTYQLEYDENGNLITNRVSINGDAIVNELGINVNQGSFENIRVKTQEEFDKVKEALLPYLKRFGLNENNIYWTKPTGPAAQSGSTVQIDLPVLNPSNIKSKSEVVTEEGKVEEETATDTVQAEPTAEVDQETEQLGKFLEAQNVDQETESIPDRRLRRQVANAVKALAKIAPSVKFVIHEDEKSYRQATDEVKREQASNGTYDPKTKTIHINLSKANARTVAHETFHAILLDRVMSDEQAAKVTKRMIDAISARLDNDPTLKRYLEDFASNYKENLKNEEKLAELVGKLAEQYESQTETFKDIIKRWLNKLAQMFGIDPITSEKETMELLETIARKVAKGKAIKEKDVSGILYKSKSKPITEAARKQANDAFKGAIDKLGISLGTVNEKTGKTKVTNYDVATALNEYYSKKHKSISITDFSEEAVETISDYAKNEILFAMSEFGNESGKGWYTEDYALALDILSSLDEDIIKDKKVKEVATAVIAVASNSTDVYTNLTRVIYAVSKFKKDGIVPSDVGTGKGASAIATGIDRYNNILSMLGGDSVRVAEFLQQIDTISNLKKKLISEFGLKSYAEALNNNLATNAEWNENETLPMSILIFGPKIGAFYSNLSGLDGTPTIDRWCIRTIYRYRGDMRSKVSEDELSAFKKDNGIENVSYSEAISLAQEHSKMFDAILTGRGDFKGISKEDRNSKLKPYRKGSQIWKKAQGVVNDISEGIESRVDNKSKYAKDFRGFTKRAFEAARDKVLKESGISLSVSDVQAILWIYEKNLFGHLGVKQREDSTYSAAAKTLVSKVKSGDISVEELISGKLSILKYPDINTDGPMGDIYGSETNSFKQGIDGAKERNSKDSNIDIDQSKVSPRKQISDRKQIESEIRRQEPVAGNKLFNDPIPEATEIAISYSKKSGIPYVNVEKITKLDENNSKAIAREFDKMKNDPTNTEVRQAYEAMVKETIAQYEEITSKGYSVEINNNEPYSSSQDMISDVRDNKRMKIFSTESGFGDIEITEEQRAENPLLQRTKFKDKNGVPLLANDLFRFVHDFFGHAKMGNSFGPIGEENAWRVHSVMYSDLARRAMTSETRGQNSWVNFSGVNDNAFKLRDKARQLRKEGKKDQADKLTEKVYEQMSFAEQKVGLMPEWVSETNGRKQISSVVNRKQDKTASSIVSIARKNGFSEAAIQKYLRDKGFSAEEISRAMAINENVNIDQIFEQSEKDLLDKRKKAGFVKSLQYTWNKLFDRQSRIKSIISKTGKTERTWYGKKIQTDKKAQRAHDLLVTKAGARGYSNYRFKEADKKIFKGLSDKLRDEFDKMIYAKRIISINENRAERGLEAYRGKDGYSEAEARRDLSDMRLRLGDKKFADLEIRAGEYFDVFEESLKHLYESGRINQGLYETLKDIEYSPITTIKYIIADNSSLDEINRQAEEFGVTRGDIMSLTDSNENSVIMDSRWLMMMNLMSVESRAFENKMLRAFADSLSDSSEDVKAALSEYIMFAKEDGTGAPVGFRRVNYFVDGKKKTLLVRSDVANQLLDVKNRSKGLETLGKLTGTQILRFFATGGNPVFIIGNTALDFSNVLFFTDVYHPIKIIGGVQLSWDFMSKFLGKIAQTGKYKQLMKEYMENGGSLEFLSSDGIRSLRDARRTTKGLNIAQKALLNIGSFMSYAGETSEIAMRMAVFGKVKSDLIAKYQKDLIEQYKKNNNGKMPKGEDLDEIKKMPEGQDLEDILRSAARQGRETVDFAQGGEWSKNADLVAPYLNAGMQGLRKPLQYAVDNPVGFANSVIQGSLMAGSLAFYSISALVSAFGGDDDDKEKAEKIKKALASVPKSDKAQYHIIFTGEKDKNGEYVYLRIKKLPLLSIATTWAEQIAYKHAIESLGGEYETNSMIETLEYSSPIIPNYRIVERNPLLAGVLGYAMNKNLFTGQDIFRQQSDKKIEPWAEGQYDNKVEPIYKWVGKHTGLSPIRTKYLVEKIITSPTTNPTVGVFYSTTSGMPMGEMWDDIKKSITENASKKLFRTTNSNLIKYAEEDKIKDEVMKLYTDRYLKEEYVKSEVNKALDEGDGLTESQLEKLVVDNFDEVDQLKYFKKYYLYTKRRDIDQTTLDLFFEDDPKVAGFLLYERFGDEIDDDEMDQLVLASEALGGARIGKKTMYHYNEYIEMYKNKK